MVNKSDGEPFVINTKQLLSYGGALPIAIIGKLVVVVWH